MAIEDVVAVVAVALTVGFTWPQVFRALRHGVHGVSVAAITLSMVSAAAWFGYGIAEGLLPVIIANLGVVTGQAVVSMELVRHGSLSKRGATGAIAAAVTLILACQVSALTTPIVTVAGVVAIVSVLTQLVEVRREPHALEGLSAGTYGILTSVSATWVLYGILEGDVVIIATNLVIFPMAAFITWAASRSHHELDELDELPPSPHP